LSDFQTAEPGAERGETGVEVMELTPICTVEVMDKAMVYLTHRHLFCDGKADEIQAVTTLPHGDGMAAIV